MDLQTLKQNKEAPEWLTDEGLTTLQNGYLLSGETPKDMWRRVCVAAAKRLNKPELEDKFFELFWNNWLCGATPVLSNMGTSRGLPISCNSIHVGDSIRSIFDKQTELAVLSKNGAGVGIYVGDVRGRGASISGNGKSEGVIPWLKCYDSTTVAVSQGCYDDQTEILTENGWILFKDLPAAGKLKVAQVNDNKIEFVDYSDYIEYHTNEDLYYFSNTDKSVDMLVTGNHNMALERRKRVSNKRNSNNKFISNKKSYTGKLELVSADQIKLHRDTKFYVALPTANKNTESLSAFEKLAIAYQADGNTKPSGNSNGNLNGEVMYNFHFSKQRKIDRLISILQETGYRYTTSVYTDKTTKISVRYPISALPSKNLSDSFDLSRFSQSTAREFIKEVGCWDGSTGKNSIEYVSTDEKNIDFVQAVATLAGLMTNKKKTVREGRKDIYKLYICLNRNSVGGETINKTRIPYNGKVYCVTVPSNIIVVRRNGRSLVCGNSVRRGASAVYLPANHSDIEEFINVRRPVGDVNRRCLNLHHAVCIDDQFMNAVQTGGSHERYLWKEILKARFETGEPYLFFTDNVNRQRPDCYVSNNLSIKTSNICNEIYLYTDPEHTFVCCLSSMNLFKYEEWKDTKAVQLSIWFLDAVIQEYIDKAQHISGLESAVRFAEKSRAVGLGVLGWHSLLQKKKLPFDSFESMRLNGEIFRYMQKETQIATKELAKEYGEPEWCKGFGIRNTHQMAVAPTVSNSIISGSVSAGIEPISANVVALKTAKGTFMRTNPILKQLLEEKGLDNIDTWKQINENSGSVSELKDLSDEEKEVFLTAREINQHAIVKQAGQRQKYIDQGQSVNLFFAKNSDPKYIHSVHMLAWEEGLKGLYYCRSEAALKGDSVNRQKEECKACEG